MFSLLIAGFIFIIGFILDLIFKGNYIFNIFLIIDIVFIFSMIIANLSVYSYQIYESERIKMYKKSIILNKNMLDDCINEIKDICMKQYPDYESKIFDKISKIEALILSFPEIKQNENVGVVVAKLEEYNREIIRLNENINRGVGYMNARIKCLWYFLPNNIEKLLKEDINE